MAGPSRPMARPSPSAAGLMARPSRPAAAGLSCPMARPSRPAALAVGSPRRQAGAVERSHLPQGDAGLSKGEVFCFIRAAVAAIGVMLVVAGFLIGPSYPTLKVTGLRVSNATWEATLLAERTGISRGTYLFYEVQCFLYYGWDAARPFAVASVEPLVLPTPGSIVIEAIMRTEMSEKEVEASVIGKMDLDRRSRGMVVVRLGLRMLGTTDFGLWFKGDRMLGTTGFGPWFKGDGVLIEARCHHLSIAFVNSSSTEGSLVTGINVGGNPLDNFPSCTYH